MLDQSWGLLAGSGASAASESALAQAVERARFSLTQAELHDVMAARRDSLASVERVELGAGVAGMLAEQLSASSFASQDSFARDLTALQSAFYRLRGELPIAVADEDVARHLVRAFDQGGGSMDAACSLTAAEVVDALEDEAAVGYEPDAGAGELEVALDFDEVDAAYRTVRSMWDEDLYTLKWGSEQW
ncbi:MAG: DUF6323 family protein [Collinsella sp.]